MLTYNHEAFVREAIESVLMQETSFAFELVIGEDCSTDGTRAIVLEYQRKYPDKIKSFLPQKNVGLIENFLSSLKICRGEYIAFIEGDDYWTSKNKLQAQADFLDETPEAPLCFTNCTVINDEGTLIRQDRVPVEFQRNLSQKDMIAGYCPPLLTLMYRNNIKNFPKEIYKIINLDYFLYLLLASRGDAFYLAENTASYRIHNEGIWSMKNSEYKYINLLKLYKVFLRLYKDRYEKILLKQLRGTYLVLLRYYLEEKRFFSFMKTLASFISFELIRTSSVARFSLGKSNS
ncbi:hypothetical protein FLAV_02054 [Flavobacteriales bacterium]|nr:hypothetical protein FLAV_02054 [Flavobacteriales bacterium]